MKFSSIKKLYGDCESGGYTTNKAKSRLVKLNCVAIRI